MDCLEQVTMWKSQSEKYTNSTRNKLENGRADSIFPLLVGALPRTHCEVKLL